MTIPANRIEQAKEATKGVYERQAGYWDEVRPTLLYEKPWLDRFTANLPAGGRLLDLGCGSGVPVAGYFLDEGFTVVGTDYAEPMIALARQRYPAAEWHVQDINHLTIMGQFDGIYSWDGFFHLSVAEQRAVLPDLCQRIKEGGAMLLTVGTGEGEVTGTIGGETVYHASLSPEEYHSLLRENGFETITFVPEDDNCRGRSVLLATGRSRDRVHR
ncbi:2-polyprenyl-3-methyl-5-hydroxy-6-metoxy-1,4-benzoquinol methylase [Parasphingorhabdus marina DSM 22363]|uniref:2-polyprenyl-3-methyl-5-hydroxy-6-metoxy-1,4-benzoquinol methylase n=1 Tax=Parasphingorhabdus marina DSM 22363 TaxID=1123272 RepID=A0A1N6CLQ6_9SPHN|nr:class I SAM-dependent methyltransferase [Parasphingorhabdus marina]SIN59490.1 2-polyprenyl-3-methyl-5-hydroxy-6-metoxy-1,4-benzoquinol methylase [Parasphingorhabdus marina DSM 22363]